MTTTTTARNLRIGDHVAGQGFMMSASESLREPGKLIVAFMHNGATHAVIVDPDHEFSNVVTARQSRRHLGL